MKKFISEVVTPQLNHHKIVKSAKQFSFDIQHFSITNQTHNTVVSGTDVGDYIYNQSNSSTINVLGGNDTIYNGFSSNYGKNVLINGGDGSDYIWNSHNISNVTIVGGSGNDTIINESYNSDGNVYVYNDGDGNDILIGMKSNDSLIIDGTRKKSRVIMTEIFFLIPKAECSF